MNFVNCFIVCECGYDNRIEDSEQRSYLCPNCGKQSPVSEFSREFFLETHGARPQGKKPKPKSRRKSKPVEDSLRLNPMEYTFRDGSIIRFIPIQPNQLVDQQAHVINLGLEKYAVEASGPQLDAENIRLSVLTKFTLFFLRYKKALKRLS